jgi:hypothetical protein
MTSVILANAASQGRAAKGDSVKGEHRWSIIVAVAIAAAVLAGAANAYHVASILHYWSGSLTTNAQKTQRAACAWAVDANEAVFTTGAGAYGTSAIINRGGSWVASGRNQSGDIWISVSPYTSGDDSSGLCRNSTPWQITVSFDCYLRERQDDNAFCV